MALASLIGPPLAAPLLFTVGIQWALLVDAASFVLSFLAIALVRVPARPAAPASTVKPSVWRELRAGAGAFLGSRVLVAVMVAGIITNFGGNVLNTVDVFFVRTNLHADPKLYGFLETAFGLGSIAGALVAGAVGQRFGLSRTFWWGLLGAGVLVVGYARTTSFPVALLVLLVAGIPIAAINTVLSPIVLREVPRDMLGRAFAFLLPAVQLSSLLAVGLAGWLASSVLTGLDARVAGVHFGTYDTLLTASGLLIVLGGLYAMVALRGTDRAPAPTPPSEPEPEPVPAPTIH